MYIVPVYYIYICINVIIINVIFNQLFFLSTLLGFAEDCKMNNTLSNTSIKCVRDTSVTAVVFPCLYSILFIFALVLNSLAAWIFFSIPSTSTFVVFLKNVVRHNGFCFMNVVVVAGQQNRKKNMCDLLTTGGGWLADDPDNPSENLERCRCGFLATTRISLPVLCSSLLHHHVHQHPLAGPHQLGPLLKDSQAIWEVRPAAGPCRSGAKCSCLGSDVIFSITQRHFKWPTTTDLWRKAEVQLHEEQSRSALAWRVQLLLSGSY